ncbi:TetR family transcriptional regulator [Amycolatopsis bartoniae]|uniref:TetR family transcriptional regulator n=2 Tax=Amycolatopsis bartoniae TaxID=941986 RepID=A0A8H9MB09_9PSEU|nr:TetR family transcriptional regulator [Amycolatopsis bartoniae]
MRTYGGVTGAGRKAERRAQLVEAGLDLLAGDGGQLTVRGVCQRAGLTARYFYESFTDRDELVSAVYEHVVTLVASRTLAAVEDAPPHAPAKIRAGLAAIVRAVAGDPRRGRVLFSVTLTEPLLTRRRLESSRFFAGLLGGQARDFYGLPETPALELAAQFLVGGLAQTLTSWLDGTLELTEDELVEECGGIFAAVAARRR